MVQNEKHDHMAFIAIVAIVAIVGLFLMLLNSGNSVTTTKASGDMAGQAIQGIQYGRNWLCMTCTNDPPPEGCSKYCGSDAEKGANKGIISQKRTKSSFADAGFKCADIYSTNLDKFEDCINNLKEQSISQGIDSSKWLPTAMEFICKHITYNYSNKEFTEKYC